MRVELRDPQGLRHVIEFDGRHWHGLDNLAHGFEPVDCRRGVIEAVLVAVTRNFGPVKVALPYGFGYAL